MSDNHPMGRDGDPRSTSAPPSLPLTDAFRYLTGQTLMVDGGYFQFA